MIRLSSIARILGVVLVIFIFHPFRFAELQMNFKTIGEAEMIDNLEQNAEISDPNESKCDINMDFLSKWTMVNSTKQSYKVHGEQWSPTHCSPRYSVTLIVPYRNRQEHLSKFIQWMHPFLQAQNLSYTIIVVEQAGNDPFNRAKLFNVGVLESKKLMKEKENQCWIFHDIDLLPLNAQNLYACSKIPIHLSAYVDTMRFNLPYAALFGGAISGE